VEQFAQIDANSLPGPCPGGIGLTTALTVLPHGWVVVGSLPTTDGTSATAKAGCLLILNAQGQVVETLSGNGINGPWDMTASSFGDDFAELFVSNVLNGTVAGGGSVVQGGTVLRIVLQLDDTRVPRELFRTVIGSGFSTKTDPAALVIGPTGLGLSADGVLFVADTVDNRIAQIPDAVFRFTSAGRGTDLTAGGALNGPLGLAIAPGGGVLTVNSGDGFIVETSRGGKQVAKLSLDNSGSPPGSGALFGLAVDHDRDAVYFVDDVTNTLNVILSR
jgi:DNA-binding beta-propeller fold protein YncE